MRLRNRLLNIFLTKRAKITQRPKHLIQRKKMAFEENRLFVFTKIVLENIFKNKKQRSH